MRVSSASSSPAVPAYLRETYSWAYLTPRAVWVFERQWLVNLILWGQFARLRDAVLDALAPARAGKVLQVACVYGDFTPCLLRQQSPGGQLTVVDVAPIQLENLARKLGADASRTGHVQWHIQDATALQLPDASQQAVVLFFLLHEQPDAVRRQTLSEAWRVLQPGGQLVVVDYHRPAAWHPLRWLMTPVLRWLEPFALDLWHHPVVHWLPSHAQPARTEHHTWLAGLYQRVVFTR